MRKYLLMLLAALTFAACSNDEKPEGQDTATSTKMMSGNYLGELKMNSSVNDALRCTLAGTNASLSDSLTIKIPLEFVAEQMMDYHPFVSI